MPYQIYINSWFGRNCNNLTQITHAFHIAECTRSQLFIPPHPNFNVPALAPHIGFSDGSPCNQVIEDNFFARHENLFNEFPLSMERRREILQLIVPLLCPDWNIDKPNHNNKELVIHIRSGDVFQRVVDSQLQAHPYFVQPPLSFYQRIINDNNFDSIQIIAEDQRNPCVDALRNSNSNAFWKKQTEQDDVNAMLNARNLVIGYGTFGFTLALANKKLQRLFSQPLPALVFGEIRDGDLADTRFSLYGVRDYIAIGDWNCSEEQLALMLSLSEDHIIAL